MVIDIRVGICHTVAEKKMQFSRQGLHVSTHSHCKVQLATVTDSGVLTRLTQWNSIRAKGFLRKQSFIVDALSSLSLSLFNH